VPIEQKRLNPEEIKRKFHRSLHIIRSIHRLKRISEDIQLYGTSSNLFDLTTRDRPTVKEVLYPSYFDHLDEQFLEERNMPPYILHPRSKIRLVWSIVMIFLLIYVATIQSYRLCFEDDTPLAWTIIDYFVDFLFFIDIIMNFISAYYNEEGRLVKNPRVLAFKYLKSWFIVDAVAVFPFELVGEVFTSHSHQLIRLIRIPRLYRLVRIAKATNMFKFLKGTKFIEWLELNSVLITLSKFILSALTVVHILCCLWYFVGKIQEDTNTWVRDNPLVEGENDKFSLYFISVYQILQTLTTVGYGDIVSKSNIEKILSIFCMIFGVGFFSYIIGILTAFLSNRENKESHIKKKLAIMDEFIDQIKAPKSLKRRLRKVLEYNAVKNAFEWANKRKIFSEIPINLRYEIVMAMHNGLLSNILLFREHSDKYFIVTITEALKPLQIKANDFIWKAGESAEFSKNSSYLLKNIVYFLVSGRAHYITYEYLNEEDRKENKKTAIVFKKVMTGSYFGEIELIKGINRMYTLQAQTDCELFYLNYQVALEFSH